jgi:hypothetical protein
MNVGDVLDDAWQVYRLLFRRSVTIAAGVYLVVDLLEELGGYNTGLRIAAGLLAIVATFAGPLLVQGALVEIVRAVHEGRRPAPIAELLSHAARRIVSLLGASIVYGFGVFFGLLALIVPGLLASARWALMVPAIMLEGHTTLDALDRSRRLVRGVDTELGDRTWTVFGVLFLTFVLTGLISSIPTAFFFVDVSRWIQLVVGVLASAVTAPYSAHVLSVLYYRFVDPDRPTIDSAVRDWPSVWEGPA